MGEWDMDAVRRLFTSLEFRTLFERLEDVGRSAKPAVEVAELDLRETTAKELGELLRAEGRSAIRLDAEPRGVHGIAVSVGGGAGGVRGGDRSAGRGRCARRPGTRAKWAHDAKELETAVLEAGATRSRASRSTPCSRDTCSIPPTANYPLAELCERYLGVDVLGVRGARRPRGSCSASAWRAVAAEAAAVALLAPVMEERIDRAGLRAPAGDGRDAARLGARADGGDAACAWTSRTSRRWASRSATGWRRCAPRSSATPGRSST